MKVSTCLYTCLCTVAAVSLPACQNDAPTQQTLNVPTSNFSVPSHPFGLAWPRPEIAFVALNGSLGVLNNLNLTHEIPLPGQNHGITTHRGKVLITSDDTGLIVVDIEDAIAGRAQPQVFNGTGASSAIEVTAYRDFAFVSQEYGVNPGQSPGDVDVFNLNGTEIGFLDLGFAVVGTALSPEKCTLYATSEVVSNGSQEGGLYAIDVATLITDPKNALRANVSAGCNPVRVEVQRDGTIWVTARASNHLLAFNPQLELLASVQVGLQPVGLTFVKDETRILTADSSRFDTNGTTGITVVNTTAALAGEDAVLGRIPTGQFPREFAVSPDGKKVLVSDFMSNVVQVIDVDELP